MGAATWTLVYMGEHDVSYRKGKKRNEDLASKSNIPCVTVATNDFSHARSKELTGFRKMN